MLIHIYEEVIDEDSCRIPGRLVAEIKCKGDGSPGKIKFLDTCNEKRETRDKTHHTYGNEIPILNERNKNYLKELFNSSSFITTRSGVDANGLHSMEGSTLGSWTREAIEDILQFKIHSRFGTICGKIIED